MATAIALREDFDGPALRRLAKGTKDAAQARRLLALAEIRDGGTRADAARVGGVGLQTIRDWVLRFNARGPAGLIDGKAPGNPSKLDDAQRRALADIVERGPIPAIDGVVRWRLTDSRIGSWRNSASRSASPRWGANCGRWGIARFWRGLATWRRTNSRSMILKKPFPPNWRDPRRPPGRHRHRNLVAG